jgi:D-inositol-3-phosphate glycosyltransferase
MKRRIGFISEHASPLATLGGVDSGGQNVYVGELARHLTTLGYEVDIFTRWDNPDLPVIVSWVTDVRVIHIKAGPIEIIEKEKIFPFMAEFADSMIAFISAEPAHYGLFHANFWMSAMIASEIKKTFSIPFVVTFHALGYIRKIYQGDNDKFPAERISIEKQIVRDADQIVAECPQDKEDLINYYEATADKITVIPCGFNPAQFYPIDKMLARMILKLDKEPFTILQLGRLVPRKGIDNVIQAVSKLKKTNRNVRLVVVGGETEDVHDGNNPEAHRLMTLAHREGVADIVRFTGRKNREELKYYYAAADVFVTTPWYEPFGITPLEAMACGTPVIGSDVGGIKFSIEDGKTGFLVPPKNPEALAEKIFELMNNAEMLRQMQRNALRRAGALFTWAKVSDMMASLYERILLLNPIYRSEEAEAIAFIEESFEEASSTFLLAKETLSISILKAASMVVNAFRKNKKVLICGNGGSAAESQHLAAELVGRFEIAHRQALPAIALTADTSTITAWANDIGYDDVFARQVEAFGQRGDILLCFSTSGQSANVIQAMKTALEKNMYCIALTGKGGGEMSSYAHVNLIVPSVSTVRIQETHLHVLHTLCSLIEGNLFKSKRQPMAVEQKVHSGKITHKRSIGTVVNDNSMK